ncbi:MAG: hypothetical protein CVU39_11890 [Chloroflexi bacterium HGW-Chloroflexi-10]|nr:MAG: hypothetical protein CVU39_11890 [Chloroflexi bacterium HGW-Chloroflexi-10]
MATQHRKWFVFFTLITILSITSGCYAFFDDGIEIEGKGERQSYTIDSASILDSLVQGNTDIFKLQEATPVMISTPISESVTWSQADFFRIAQALYQKSWQETLGEQNLYAVAFVMDCSDIERGTFSKAEFYSFKIIKTGEEDTRVEYYIRIAPSENLVSTSKVEFSPSLHIMKPIDLEEYQISAEAALQIAEKNGGAEKRLEYKNECLINTIAPGPDGKGWRVTYVNINNKIESYLKIAINPETGESKVLKSKP